MLNFANINTKKLLLLQAMETVMDKMVNISHLMETEMVMENQVLFMDHQMVIVMAMVMATEMEMAMEMVM